MDSTKNWLLTLEFNYIAYNVDKSKRKSNYTDIVLFLIIEKTVKISIK